MKEKKQKQSVYDREQVVRLSLPIQFMLLCKLLQIPAMKILDDFMVNVGGDSHRKFDDKECRLKAIDYFIQCGYGKDYYSEQDIRKMFDELHAIGLLWPKTDDEDVIEWHAKWREKYYQYWYKKYWRKIRRKM